MEIELEEVREVHAPADVCWQLVSDPSRAPEWMTIVDHAEAEGEPGEGRVIHARGGLLGIKIRTEQRVHLWEPDTRYGWRGERPFPLVIEVTLEDLGEDHTRFHVWGWARPGGFFPVGKRLVKRAVRGHLERSADRFLELVEGSWA